MTSFEPRSAYSDEELQQLYPEGLRLQFVQVLLRHGERSPVNARFRNAGLPPYWAYCNAAKHLTSAIMTTKDGDTFDELKFRRRLETFGKDDGPIVASGPKGETDGICLPGELTDQGRHTTLRLGERLRHLYVKQLGFLPDKLQNSEMIYLRATPIPRALESVQQAFWGIYPPSSWAVGSPLPTITTRTPAEETLFPNDGTCRRFALLSRAFAQRTADRWNDTPDMDYLNKIYSKWMPENSKRVAVDSHPRLSGIMDTVNATLAHGPETRLPELFYDRKARDIIDKIAVEEWYSGYDESHEYRSLGIGALAGDIVSRMIGRVERSASDSQMQRGGSDSKKANDSDIKLGLSGCHDTTLAALLSSLGAFEGEKWPPFTSHVAVELFSKSTTSPGRPANTGISHLPGQSKGWWESLFGNASNILLRNPSPSTASKTPTTDLSQAQKESLDGHYVRIRYNDRVMQVPGCKAAGKHLDGDTTFCTLLVFVLITLSAKAAFKEIVDKFTPKNWKKACLANLDAAPFPEKPEPAGIA